jgi:hypothetical protein
VSPLFPQCKFPQPKTTCKWYINIPFVMIGSVSVDEVDCLLMVDRALDE